MPQQNVELFMVQEIDETNRTITLYDPIYDNTIKHISKDPDEIEVYSSIFDDCMEINIFLSVEYNKQTQEILRA